MARPNSWGAVRDSHSADGALPLMHQFFAGNPLQVLEVDLILVRLWQLERFENLQGHARIHRAAFRIEGAIGGEQDLLDRVELKPAFGRRHSAERRSVRE